MWVSDNYVPANILLYLLYCDIIRLINIKITQAFHLLLGLAENQMGFQNLK